jgi:isochorismate synthase
VTSPPPTRSAAKFADLARETGKRLDAAVGRVADEAARQADETRIPVLVSVAVPIPAIRPLDLLEKSDDPISGWWSQPGFEVAGTGIAVTYETSGAERLADLATALSERFAIGVADGRMPAAFAGGAFAARNPQGAWSNFPQAAAWVPETSVIRDADGTWLAGATVVNPGEPPLAAREHLASLFGEAGAVLKRENPAHVAPAERSVAILPSDEAWEQAIADALRQIQDGALQKVVLARVRQIDSAGTPPPWVLAQAMASAYPDAFLYAAGRGDSTFVGATPELLVELRDEQVRATPAAGTVAIDAADDELDTAKTLREHAFVATAVSDTLRLWCDDVRSEPKAHVINAGPVRHLATTVEGRLSRPAHVLELAGALHPTPAVCGVPLHRAAEFIREHEPFDRGWYAGPIGVVHPDGSGTIAIALRCALLHRDGVDCFAGAGIVEGSEADDERLEIDLKMRAVLSQLESISG